MSLKIALGTESSDKLGILKSFLEVAGHDAQITATEVKSEPAKQPRGEKQTTTEAINRAKLALKSVSGSDWGVGMEGGLEKVDDLGLFLVCVVAIMDSKENIYLGVSGKLQLPQEMSAAIEQGHALGDVIEEFANKQKSEAGQDIAGVISSRREAFMQAIGNAILYKNYTEAAKTR